LFNFFGILDSWKTRFSDDLFGADSGDDPFASIDLMDDIGSIADDSVINPANGETMIGGIGGIDTDGNPFGMDAFHHDVFDNQSDFGISTDGFGSCDSLFENTFNGFGTDSLDIGGPLFDD
jgi:hypothetical protein